jgi:hypothetical protein
MGLSLCFMHSCLVLSRQQIQKRPLDSKRYNVHVVYSSNSSVGSLQSPETNSQYSKATSRKTAFLSGAVTLALLYISKFNMTIQSAHTHHQVGNRYCSEAGLRVLKGRALCSHAHKRRGQLNRPKAGEFSFTFVQDASHGAFQPFARNANGDARSPCSGHAQARKRPDRRVVPVPGRRLCFIGCKTCDFSIIFARQISNRIHAMITLFSVWQCVL